MKALSNSPQEGADGYFLWLTLVDGIPSDVSDPQSSFTGFFDQPKNIDVNVQVYGSQVPLPPTLLLLGSGLLGLAGWRRFGKN